MIRKIRTARVGHSAKSPSHLAEKHAAFIQKKRANGEVITIEEDPTPQTAYVNDGYWVFNCICGAGVLTDPAWRVGRCFGCGTVYPNVVFPDDIASIEAVLIERRTLATRHWVPGEPVENLVAENIAHGVPVPEGIG